ncbi:MAG: response regulator, partial [Bacteroidota bacterium]
MSLDCLIIDDEPLAREGIANYVRQVDFLQLRGLGANPIELGSLLAYEPADLIFLDIQMPLMNGLDFLRQAPNAPLVIITTAFPGYAVESFSLDV